MPRTTIPAASGIGADGEQKMPVQRGYLRRAMSLLGSGSPEPEPLDEDDPSIAGSTVLLLIALVCLFGTMVFFVATDKVINMHNAGGVPGSLKPSSTRKATGSSSGVEAGVVFRQWEAPDSVDHFPPRPLSSSGKRVSFHDLVEISEEAQPTSSQRLLPHIATVDQRPYPNYGGTESIRPPPALRNPTLTRTNP